MTTAAREGRVLRIVFCHYTSDICGGSDRALFDLVSHLPRDRFESIMILKRGDPMAEAYRDESIEVHETSFVPPRRALEPMKLAKFFLTYGPTVFRLVCLLRRIRPDIVHVNTLFNVHAPLAARCAGYPLVWHIRELLPHSRVYAALCFMARCLATRAAVISNAVSEAVATLGDRRRLIVDGIDMKPYQLDPNTDHRGVLRAELRIANDAPIVTVIGRLEPWKGQHVFVESIPIILQAIPGARFLIVGGPAKNKPEYALSLKARCQELDIEDRVCFTGIRSDIPAVLAASDILVLPTVTPEPFGLTVLEAMAARRPVVATEAGGPLDSVVHNETGLLVKPDDKEALADAIIELLGAPDTANEMGRRGLARVAAKFTIDRVAAEMADLFWEVYDETHVNL